VTKQYLENGQAEAGWTASRRSLQQVRCHKPQGPAILPVKPQRPPKVQGCPRKSNEIHAATDSTCPSGKRA